jgi:tetratricopeptide (TPR) repeat protein
MNHYKIKIFKNAVDYYNKGNYEKSLENYIEYLKIDSNNIIVNCNIGVIYIKNKDYKKAFIFLNKCLSIDKNYINSYINIGYCYNEIKQYNKSLEYSEKGLKILSKYIGINNENFKIYKNNLKKIYNNIGISHKKLKNYINGIIYFDKCIELDNFYIEAYNNKSTCEYEIGNIEYAINILEMVCKMNSNYYNALDNLIKFYFSLELFDNILNLDKKYFYESQNNIYLSLIYYINGDNKRFKECIIENKNIKSNDHRFTIPYVNLLNNICEKYVIDNQKYDDIIYHIGDSHSLSTTNRKIKIKDKNYKIETKLIIGCKAFHLNNKTELNNYKLNFIEKIRKIKQKKKGKYILITLGEIDCRLNEGILHYHNKTKILLEEIINNTVNNYINFLKENMKDIKKQYIYICNIPYPKCKNFKQIKIINLFNEKLKYYIKNSNFKIINLNYYTKNSSKYYIDNHHLSFDLYKKAFNQNIS